MSQVGLCAIGKSTTLESHIPSLLVVDPWASDVKSSAPLDLLLLHSVWKRCGRRMSGK